MDLFGSEFLELGVRGEGGTCRAKVVSFLAMEAEPISLIMPVFFGREFGNFDGIYVHYIRVLCSRRREHGE